jgi:hypothetical protein
MSRFDGRNEEAPPALPPGPPGPPAPPPLTWETVINSPQGQAAIQKAREELAAYPSVLALFNAFLREGPAWISRVMAALPEAAKTARQVVAELDQKLRQGKLLPPSAHTTVLGLPVWALAGGVGLYLLLSKRRR